MAIGDFIPDWFGGGGNKESMNSTEETVGSTNTSTTTVVMDKPKDEHMVPDETGAIAGVIFGILVCVVLILVALFLYRRHRRERELEFQRARHAQMSSMMNAGVYMDTTTTDSLVPKNSPVVKMGPDSAYKSLPANRDLYEQDSDDEI